MAKEGIIERIKKQFIDYIGIRINEPWYSLIINAYNSFYAFFHKEKMYSYGINNPDEVLYIISINDSVCGFASFYDMVLGHLIYCQKKGYIPIIDLSNSNNIAIYDNEMNGNPWTYYFEQPIINGKRYSLDDAYNSKNVIVSDPNRVVMYKRVNNKEILKRKKVLDLIPYNKETAEHMRNCENELFSILDETGIIGAYYRGTDYKAYDNWTPLGHAKAPAIQSFVEDLKEYAISVNCRNIFFMSDEQEAIDYIIDNLSNTYNVSYIKHPRYSGFKSGKAVSEKTPLNISRYENNLYYLTDIDILSKCTYLFGIKNAGVQMALNLNGNKYKDVHILNTNYYS